jgi:threonine dehydrogenase-like Zn-dependent dehydrogenase
MQNVGEHDMQSGAGVTERTGVVAALVDGSRTLVELAQVSDTTTSAADARVFALGLPSGAPGGPPAWTTVGHLNLESTRAEHILLAGLSALAMKHVRAAEVQIGDAVLVCGHDPWSLLLLQWARLQGASPLVFAGRGSDRLAELASSLGIEGTLKDPTSSDISRALKLTYRGAGFAFVFDGLATEQSVSQSLAALRDGGRYVLAGLNPARQIALNAYPDLHRRDLEVMSPMHTPFDADVATMLRFSLTLIEQGRLRVEGLLDPAFGWRAVLTGHA